MTRFRMLRAVMAATITLVALVVGEIASPVLPAHAAGAGWYDGSIAYSDIINCVSIIQGAPYAEKGVGTYVGFYANPEANQPAPNQTYYIQAVVAGLGNPCTGGSRVDINVQLPP